MSHSKENPEKDVRKIYFFQVLMTADHLQGLLSVVFRVLLHALASNQSTITLTNMFNTQRALVAKVSRWVSVIYLL